MQRLMLLSDFLELTMSFLRSHNYKILVIKNVIANSVNIPRWTFVVVERQKQILEKLIPKELW
jgi:hypothetical protein